MNPELPGVNMYITTCLHGVDLRFTPRCYLCKPWPDDSPVWKVASPGHVHEGEWCAMCVEAGGEARERTLRERGWVDQFDTTTWRCGGPSNRGQSQQYPGRFLLNLRKTYPEMMADDALQMFSGASDFGVTTDFREETGADIIAPFDAIPRPDGSFSAVIADPPYADHWQGQWHGGLPKPKHILREAVRLVRPGGLIGILHIIVIPAYAEFGVTRVALHPVLAGPNNAIRVFNVLRAALEEPTP